MLITVASTIYDVTEILLPRDGQGDSRSWISEAFGENVLDASIRWCVVETRLPHLLLDAAQAACAGNTGVSEVRGFHSVEKIIQNGRGGHFLMMMMMITI